MIYFIIISKAWETQLRSDHLNFLKLFQSYIKKFKLILRVDHNFNILFFSYLLLFAKYVRCSRFHNKIFKIYLSCFGSMRRYILLFVVKLQFSINKEQGNFWIAFKLKDFMIIISILGKHYRLMWYKLSNLMSLNPFVRINKTSAGISGGIFLNVFWKEYIQQWLLSLSIFKTQFRSCFNLSVTKRNKCATEKLFWNDLYIYNNNRDKSIIRNSF